MEIDSILDDIDNWGEKPKETPTTPKRTQRPKATPIVHEDDALDAIEFCYSQTRSKYSIAIKKEKQKKARCQRTHETYIEPPWLKCLFRAEKYIQERKNEHS